MDFDFRIEPLTERYLDWVRAQLTDQWSSPQIISRGRLHQADALPSFIALVGDEPQGLLTYRIEDEECEVVTLHSLTEGIGILHRSAPHRAPTGGGARLPSALARHLER